MEKRKEQPYFCTKQSLKSSMNNYIEVTDNVTVNKKEKLINDFVKLKFHRQNFDEFDLNFINISSLIISSDRNK